MNNPLSATPHAPQQQHDPDMHRHVMIWSHMHQQDGDTLRKHVDSLDYGLPVLGALAANPKVKPKDVIKAVGRAVGDQKMDPEAGVALVSSMPADQDQLRVWLREHYVNNLTAAVHAKAALISQASGRSPLQAPQMPSPLAAPMGGMPNG